jgi:multidrug efflux pump subunit AcrA (membrane-fusion protein)
MTRFSYQDLLALVDGDGALLELLVEEGEIVRVGDDIARVDVDRVLVARTLLRDLDVTWPGAEVILELRAQLVAARRRIAALEAELAAKR